METVAKLLDSAGTKEEKGYTALHLAVQAGNSDLVRQLLPLPACDPSAKDIDGLTALHWAASKGKLHWLPPCADALSATLVSSTYCSVCFTHQQALLVIMMLLPTLGCKGSWSVQT